MRLLELTLLIFAACHAGAAAPQSPPQSHAEPPAPRPRKVVTDTEIQLLDPIHFVGAQLQPGSEVTLDAIANTLTGNPGILVVEFDAFATTQVLADLRARTCATYLVAHGVAPNRLRPVGVVGSADGTRVLILQRAP